MKKLPLIITLLFGAAIVGAFVYYSYFQNQSSISPWDIIPKKAILVYEPGDCAQCLREAEKSSLWQAFSKSSQYDKSVDTIPEFSDLFRQLNFPLISLHPIKNDDFDFVLYSPLRKSTIASFDSLLQKIKRNKNVRLSSREFKSVKIEEVKVGKSIFSWAVMKNVWVGSFTPFLIEDVVRTYEDGVQESFRASVIDHQQKQRANGESGNLYVDLGNFSRWLSVFTEAELPFMLKNIGKSVVLEAKIDDKTAVLTGLSSDSVNQSNYALSLFGGQSPVPFSLKQFVSNRAVALVSYGVSDGNTFSQSIRKFPEQHRKQLNDTLATLSKTLSVNVASIYDNLSGEIGLGYVESREKRVAKILMVQTKNKDEVLKAFQTLSEKVSIDTLFVEHFSDYEIREVPLYNFPEKILWPLVSGFKTTFYTSIGNTIFIAEDIEELKKYLDDFDREETWGKSVSQNQFLETTLLEANLSVYINTPKVWNFLSARMRPDWQQFVLDNRTLLNSIKMGAVQFSHLNDSYYTNLSWAQSPFTSKQKAEKPKAVDRVLTNFSSSLHKSFIVESHVNSVDEVIVQDSSSDVSLVSNEGKVLWHTEVDQPIIGEVYQIDYYKNGKLQYLFATPTMLYLIDRLGKPVDKFPITLPVKDVEYLSVIDYDHSKKYRFLVSNRSGKLWMYDKEGKLLDGWRPNNAEGNLLTPPRHHRIKGKDYIISVRTDGTIFLMNRRGELYKNFPLKLGTRLSGNYFLEIGNTLANSHFVVVTRDGSKIKFSLEGKILNRETLVKTAFDAQFTLICDENRRSYIVARQENKALTLFDESGKEILKNEYVGMHNARIDYFDFGSGNVYYTITDRQENLSFVYDAKGNALTNAPVESDWIGVRQREDGLMFFSTLKKTLTMQHVH